MYVIETTETFTNYYTHAKRTRVYRRVRSEALIRAPGGYQGDDGFRRTEFGNGSIEVIESVIGPATEDDIRQYKTDELKPGEGFENLDAYHAHCVAWHKELVATLHKISEWRKNGWEGYDPFDEEDYED